MIKVFGDIMLDRWIEGTVDRISPEAPIPVLLETEQKFSVGGAGNLALNLNSINNNVSLHGVIATDKEGYKILELLKDTTLDVNVSTDCKVTTTKTRLVGSGGQHILRWDREEHYQLKTAFEKFIPSVTENDIVCVSDYNKGTVTKDTVSKILEKTKTVLVDPKQGPEMYKGAFLVKPNMKEYEQWFGPFRKEIALLKMKEYDWNWLVVTDGAKGIHVLDNSGNYNHFAEEVHEVSDVTGAGDTVMAVIAYGIEKGLSIPNSCEIACYAASRVVERRGVSIVTDNDLNRGVVWTNGVFDILHNGHLKLLRHAYTLGKRLVVGINSDASVKRLKGELRPINNEFVRKQQLENLGFIDDVVIFDNDTPIDEILSIKPDIIVKGGDYTVEEVVGHEYAKVEIFPLVNGYSTTDSIEKIRQQQDPRNNQPAFKGAR